MEEDVCASFFPVKISTTYPSISAVFARDDFTHVLSSITTAYYCFEVTEVSNALKHMNASCC